MVDTPAGGRSVRRLQRLVLAWFAVEGRTLPWRSMRDPYRVLVSEIMLQQTQVSRVVPLYEAFLERFPDVGALAAAPTADVLTAWRGLGYNRRALNLQRAARAVVAEHGGRMPMGLKELQTLPGVGAYTARAVRAFAHGSDEAPVDTNVARVLSRAVAGTAQSRAQTQRLADDVVPRGRGRDWTGALMDLGARYCTARAPRCDACPVAAACVWRRVGGEDPAAGNAVRARPQGRFAGSDRYHRGRLVDALRHGPLPAERLGEGANLEDAGRVAALADGLVRDGLAEWDDGALRLPG